MGIDALNRQNPLVLFGITMFADESEEERSMRRMSKKVSNYAAFKASLPKDMAAAVAAGPDALKGKSFKVSEADRQQEGWIDVDQVEWADEDMCAACSLYPGFKDYTTDNRPSDFDWRDLGAVTSVKNQKYCGSCWTFSTAADIEGSHFLATGNLTSMSEQQLVACDNMNDGCEGGWPYAAMQYVETLALVSDADYPYKGIFMDYEQAIPTCDQELLQKKMEKDSFDVAHIGGFQFVAMGADYEPLMALAMVKNGPLSIAFNANGMEYYVHGIIGCETIADSEYCGRQHRRPL